MTIDQKIEILQAIKNNKKIQYKRLKKSNSIPFWHNIDMTTNESLSIRVMKKNGVPQLSFWKR